MDNFQIRFGRVTEDRLPTTRSRSMWGQRCSTLVTLRDDETIYFGISKRNLVDQWDKKVGVQKATDRMNLMVNGGPKSFNYKDGLKIHHSGMFGSCPVSSVKVLISYFRDVTDFLPEKSDGSKSEP